jgi:hypothetical protein
MRLKYTPIHQGQLQSVIEQPYSVLRPSGTRAVLSEELNVFPAASSPATHGIRVAGDRALISS